MSQTRRGHHNAGGGYDAPPKPAVPSIPRRSNSFQQNDDMVAMMSSRSNSATDEFGFPLTQQLRSSSSSSFSVPHVHVKTDLEKVRRPSRLQQQQRGHSTQQLRNNHAVQQQRHSQHLNQSQTYSNEPPRSGPPPPMTRNNSAPSSSLPMQRVPSKIKTSSSSRPPRSHNNVSLHRQPSHQSSASSSRQSKPSRKAPPKMTVSKPDKARYKNYTFQHPANAMRLTVRTVDLSHRIAFDTRMPREASSAALRRMLDEMDRVRGSRSVPGSVVEDVDRAAKRRDNPCRISPSPNHVAILEFVHGSRGPQSLTGRDRRRVVRQLQWNAACGVDADPWFDGSYEDEQDSSLSKPGSKGVPSDNRREDFARPTRRRPNSAHGDGRYVPVDPVAATRAALPDHSPILTNVKRRLPTRADVGFSNPSPEDVARKMEDVKREAQWEEASPRMVLLASGYRLFDEEEDDMDELHPSCRSDAKLWSGGSILGVPFAGRDLVSAFKMTARLEGGDEAKSKNQRTDVEHAADPRSYSVLAPPVDATFSASHVWRPRPFTDRPPGHVYLLACPLDVRLEGGDEPLFCTMALYSLPPGSTSVLEDGNGSDGGNWFRGKISEDFHFPAGDWNGIERGEGSFDDEEDDDRPQSWRRRKRRAVMSYDPLEVSAEDLHLVIQVFRAARPDEGQVQNVSSQSNKSIGSKIKRTLGKSRDRERNHATIEYPSNENSTNLHASFEETGARYLTPVCFSVTPVFATADVRQKQEVASFFSFPDSAESHEDFLERLSRLSETNPIPHGGYTDLFTSHLDGDFTRALLDEPPQLRGDAPDDAAPLGPQLLADVMGDCAISFDGLLASEGSKSQRSKLRRLPPSRESGYASSFDLKEVLYLPPRFSPRKYEDDTGLCSSTALNLLYVYPRLIRWNSGRRGSHSQLGGNERLSLRIQVVEQELPPDQSFDDSDPMYQALQAIYNPSSPAGPPLVESFYTKLVGQDDKRDSKTKSGRKDIPLKDEVKVRLPDILDRRHFLRTSLFSVRSDSDVELLAETTIPFIISSKESTSGTRVTTIIPNGLHRIQLGEGLQIHVETRLASSSHVSDPSVATLLRDYPIVSSNIAGDLDSTRDSIGSSSDVIVHSSSGFPFLDILTMASGQAVKRHFWSLATVNMLNLANQKCPPFYFEQLFDMFGSDVTWHRLVSWEKTDPLLAIVRSIFEILDKTRTSYQERDQSTISLQYRRLIKSFLDAFDEPLFASYNSDAEMQYSELGDSSSDKNFNDSSDSHAFNDLSHYTDPSFELNDSKNDRSLRIPKYQFTPRNNMNPRSFLRSAYVATRTEQIKAEADLNDDDIYGREYFDDDETVITLGTTTSRFDSGGSVFPILETKLSSSSQFQGEIIQTNSSTLGIQESNTSWTCGSGIVNTSPPKRRRSPRKNGNSTPFSFATKRAEYVASRVNTFAQLVMAPCTAPSVDDMIAGGVNGSSLTNGKIQSSSKVTSYGATGNQNQSPFESSSDAEEDGETSSISPHLRGNQSCLKIPPLVFRPMRVSDDSSANGENIPKSSAPCLYEMLMALWVQAWTSLAASMKSDAQIRGDGDSVWPFELVQGSHNSTRDAVVAFSFVRHLSFFLPLCLKSLGLRCVQSNTTKLVVPMTFLDDHHMQILVPLVETIALGLMRDAMSGSSGQANAEQMLLKALTNSDEVLDFVIGLFALLHPSQIETLLIAYFNLLKSCEDPIGKGPNGPDNMSKSYLRRIKCSRLIRLHAVERLSVIPAFARLNFPLKFTGFYPRRKVVASSWTNQRTGNRPEFDPLRKHWEKMDRSPQSFWLSGLLMNQCLSICNGVCGLIITEANKQAKAIKCGRKADDALSRSDLLRMESLAFHSILCAYELLVKRHAMDSRFQSISSGTRVAALFAGPVLRQSVDAVSLLARMDPDQKVRVIWLLCLLYILQEGPDALIRHELCRFCDPENSRINSFVQLLKLASLSCQHFIPSDESLPVLCPKEMTQEAFNCLSASVILLIDECLDVVSKDEYELENLARSVFDLLLHLLSTPQSSVTLLRTLGGSAHALDKFGVIMFLRTVGNQLQHWARIVLTMMNSMELSVRSMAVDFLVSLIGYIYQESGSIGSISLCMLSVLPEVVAREIALCSVSGLITSMEDVECSLWPLRRAFADVEETSPYDDDRVDHQLLPSLTTLCRTGQAVIDGVLVELRLKGSTGLNLEEITKAQCSCPTSGFRQFHSLPPKTVYDADEESILEAATYFSHDTSLMQRLRWLSTLTDLHVAKKQWMEVAECLILCAHSLIKSLDHISNFWRPSRFDLWSDYRRSPWLSSVGSTESQGNAAVIEFAHSFLEPNVFNQHHTKITAQHYPSVEGVCSMLISVVNQIEAAYAEEDGTDDLACSHLEELLSMITATINVESRRYPDALAALRRVRAQICSKLAIISERDVGKGWTTHQEGSNGPLTYVRVILHGNRPQRFKESTTIPTFFEWEMPSICRVPKSTLMTAVSTKHEKETWEECICRTFAKPLVEALESVDANRSIVATDEIATDETKTYISVMVVQKKSSIKSRKFFVRHERDGSITEYTVAHKFPHALSRQRSLITSEIKVTGQK